MSSGTGHKLYNYEVAPPAGVWERVSSELDASELSLKFPAALYQLEVTPPAHAWQGITDILDDQPAYAAKLAAMAVTPPATAWDKIETGLGHIPARRRPISPVIRYAAAAMLTGLMAWAGYQFFGQKPEQTEVASQPVTETGAGNSPSHNLSALLDANVAVTDIHASLEEARNDAALEASKTTFARLDVAEKKSKVKNAHQFFFVSDEYEPAGTRGLSLEPEEIRPVSLADRYIMLMTPEGRIIRMSKKLGELVCCVSGEEQDKDCMDQLKKWREKIAHPSTAHSSGNIMDILSLMQAAENQ